jgi:ATP-dependent Clp protease protease subunit
MFSNKRQLGDIYYGISRKNKKSKKDTDSDKSSSESNDDNDILANLTKKGNDDKITRDNNHIYFHSEVDRESIFQLTSLINEAEEENVFTSFKLNIDPIPIYLHINSYGGSIYAAFAAIDVIESCKVPIYTIIEGATASAGTLISVFGKKRFIRPRAHMLIHQLSSSCWGKMHEIEDEYKNLTELMEKITKIYREKTSIPKKELTELLKHDLWLDADKSIKYGLVDEKWNN